MVSKVLLHSPVMKSTIGTIGKGPFRFLVTGIFGITSRGGPHISVGIFRPKFAVPFGHRLKAGLDSGLWTLDFFF